MGRAGRRPYARRGRRGDRIRAGVSRDARHDLVRGRVSRTRRRSRASGSRPCSRSSPPRERPRRSSTPPPAASQGRSTRSPTRLERTQGRRPGRRRAVDHERRDRGAGARSRSRSSIPATSSSSKAPPTWARSRPFAATRRSSSRWRWTPTVSTSRISARRLSRGLRPKLVYTIPDHQNPAGVSLPRPARAPRRARPPVRVPDRRGRRLPGAPLRRGPVAEPLERSPRTSSSRPGRPRRHCSRAFRLGWAVGPRRHLRPTRVGEAEHRSVRRRSRATPLRGVRSPRLDGRAAGPVSCALRRKAERTLTALERSMPDGTRWTRPDGGFFTWLTLPAGADRSRSRRVRVIVASASSPARLFFTDGQRRRRRPARVQHGRRRADRRRDRAARVADHPLSEGERRDRPGSHAVPLGRRATRTWSTPSSPDG